MILGHKVGFGTDISQSFQVCKVKNVILPVLLVRQEFKSGPWFSSCAGIIRDMGFHLAPHTSVQLLSSLLGIQEMKGSRERGIYFINNGREGFF